MFKLQNQGVRDYPLFSPGSRVAVTYNDSGIWPKKFTGIVEEVYPKFAVIQVVPTGYKTTVHVADYGLVRSAK